MEAQHRASRDPDLYSLPYAVWRAGLYACLTRARDLPSGMLVLHAGEPLVPAASLRRDAYVPVIAALAGAHRWDALQDLYTHLWGGPDKDDAGDVSARPSLAVPDERLVVYGANLAVDSGRVHVAAALISQASRAGCEPTAYSYSVLLKGYGRARKLSAVTRTLSAMRHDSIPFDNVTFNSAVDAFVRCGHMTAARGFVDDPANASLRDTRSFNILIKGLARRGRVDEAFAVRDEIVGAGLVPNEVTQNSLVDACVRVGDFPSALRLAREMRPGPGSVQGTGPDRRNQLTIALSRILGGMAEAGKVDDAVRLLDEMSRRGAPPNHITYCSLINACLKQNDVPRAMKIFQTQMKLTGRPPTLQVYNSMIAGLCKAGDEFYVDTAVRMLGGMRLNLRNVPGSSPKSSGEEGSLDGSGEAVRLRSDVKPSDVTYNAVIDGLVNFNRVHDAEDVLEWMREDGVTPSVITYTTLIKGWGGERDLGEARRVFRCMTQEGIAADTLAYNAFLNACVRAENVEAAKQVLDMVESGMEDEDVRPDVYTYTPLLALYTRQGDLDAMWGTYRRGREHGMRVNKYVIDLVVNGIVTMGFSRVRQGRGGEREAIADMAVGILDDAWDECGDVTAGRQWRKRLLEMFRFDEELGSRVAYAGGAGSLRSASEIIFERHGWNEISSGWRAF